MTSQINSILNLIANIMLLIGGYQFYIHFIIKEMKFFHTMRFFTAMLVTGALARVLFEINVLYTGVNNNFNILEASIALSRNLGLGGILLYLTTKYRK